MQGWLNAGRSFGILCVVLFTVRLQGADFYVSPNGTPEGPGTVAQPYDLTTALLGARPGYTIWLLGGNYRIGHVETKIAGAPEAPITFRQVPGQKARVDGSITFFESVGHVILRDFELFSSDTNRASSQTGVGFNVTDIQIIPGIASFAPNLSFINLIVHDHTRHGFYASRISTNNLIYGCIVYNNGWVSPDNAEGHGIYVQGGIGTQEIADNVVFQSSGANMHVYDNGSAQRLVGITLDGNVAFNAGAIQNVRVYRDWIVGVDEPGLGADGIILKNNMGWASLLHAEIGRQGTNGSVTLLNNYFPQGLAVKNWGTAEVVSNVFSAASGNTVVALDQTQVAFSATWDNNLYAHPAQQRNFVVNASGYSFSEWQSVTGYDQNSTYSNSLTGTHVCIRTNRYEAGRANIIVYNWDNVNTVTVDVSSALTAGAAYEVRNVQDFFGAPVATGVFNGQLLELPMNGLAVAAPNGPLLTPPPIGPTFNVFVLLPGSVRLQIAVVGGQAQVSWPTNAGGWVLQRCDNPSLDGGWTDDAGIPQIRNDRYVVTSSLASGGRFYRLRAAP